MTHCKTRLKAWLPRPALAFAVLVLGVLVMGNGGDQRAHNVHGAVYEWAQSHSGQPVPVIVRMDGPDAGVIAANGGVMTRKLDIISSFSAQVPAASLARLAGSEGVEWISLDAPVTSATVVPPPTAFDTASTCAPGNALSFSWAHTVGNGSNRLLLVNVSVRNNASQKVSSVTYAGKSLTQVGYVANSSYVRAELWRLVNPPTGTSDVVVNLYAAANAVCSATSWSGVNQSTPLGSKVTTTGNSTSPYKAVTSATNDVVYDALAALTDVTATAGAGQTERVNQAVPVTVRAASASAPGASSVTMSYTLASAQPWAILAVPIKAAPVKDPSYVATAYPFAVNAPAVWDGSPSRTGRGVTVAVVDTGITASSTDFKDASKASRVAFNVKTNANTTTLTDGYGHGTHVAGIIGGDGDAIRGKYIGIAPDVKLGNVKVSDNLGNSTLSDVVAGLQWVYDNRAAYNIRVVNLSLQSSVAQSYTTDPLDAAVEMLWFKGIVVVASSGNLGTVPDAVSYAPANDPYIIVVGAVDDIGTRAQTDDYVTDWSSRGYTQDGFYKPDVAAPGRRIISDIDTSSYLATHYPGYLVDNKYFTMSGTSMAAPVGCGVVALMLEQNPNLSPGQIKYVLTHTGNSIIGDNIAKELDASQATFYAGAIGNTDDGLVPNSLVANSSGSLSFNSTVKWESFPDK